MSPIMDRLVASPCCTPQLELEPVLAAASAMGFTKYEAFVSWVQAAFDYRKGAAPYLELACRYGLRYVSVHLPEVNDDLDASLQTSIATARFAKDLGASVVLFKATSRDNYARAAGRFLDAVEGTGLTPVVQNHAGSPISSLADFREVLERIDDPRMKAILEVGHFHKAGVRWQDAYDLLAGRIALVHIKDMKGRDSVPYGTGEINLPEIIRTVDAGGYRGDYVVEIEIRTPEDTLRHWRSAVDYLKTHC